MRARPVTQTLNNNQKESQQTPNTLQYSPFSLNSAANSTPMSLNLGRSRQAQSLSNRNVNPVTNFVNSKSFNQQQPQLNNNVNSVNSASLSNFSHQNQQQALLINNNTNSSENYNLQQSLLSTNLNLKQKQALPMYNIMDFLGNFNQQQPLLSNNVNLANSVCWTNFNLNQRQVLPLHNNVYSKSFNLYQQQSSSNSVNTDNSNSQQQQLVSMRKNACRKDQQQPPVSDNLDPSSSNYLQYQQPPPNAVPPSSTHLQCQQLTPVTNIKPSVVNMNPVKFGDQNSIQQVTMQASSLPQNVQNQQHTPVNSVTSGDIILQQATSQAFGLARNLFRLLQEQQNTDHRHITSQSHSQISKGIPSLEEGKNSTEDNLKEIDTIISKIVGLEGVKLQMRKWVKGLALYEKRKTLGLKVGTRKALHMAFLGNPGTGKTMVARILGNILHKLGLISTDKVTEVQRTDLVGEYIGHTGPKTRKKIAEAKGGILFVDEAYRLMPDLMKDVGKEALEEIMSAMDNGDIVSIFAGYTKDMERVISSNAGFARRVSKFFYFEDYTPMDIALILQSKMSMQDESSFVYGYKLHSDCTVKALARLISEHSPEELLKKMNGGLVDPLLVNTLESMDLRLDMDCTDADTLTTITMRDLEGGLQSLSRCGGAFFNDQAKAQHRKCIIMTGESCDIEANLKEIDSIISTIVGLEKVKLQLRKWVKGLVLYEKRKNLGFQMGTRKALHMAFLGNPGTGKTMVARILGKILHRLGLVSSYTVTEVQRTDLVSEHIGKTGIKTREKIEEAQGGILFVDEAYRLMPRNMPRDFGIEALEEIMSAMDSGDIVAIFAGYSAEMERVISSNAGFARRVSKFLNFEDYTPRDIALILQSKMKNQDEKSFVSGFKLHPDCTVKAMSKLIKEHTTEEQLKKMNGGLVDPLLVNAIENLDLRMDMTSRDETLITITMKDLEEGLKSLSNSKEKSYSFEDICCLVDD